MMETCRAAPIKDLHRKFPCFLLYRGETGNFLGYGNHRGNDMETKSFKALSAQVLQGNPQGNHRETSDPKEEREQGNQKGNRNIDGMQAEYMNLLRRHWSIDDDPDVTMEEARQLVDRLDVLYQQLHRQGYKVPVRLPMERSNAA